MNQQEAAAALQAKFPDAKVTIIPDQRLPGIAAELSGERCSWTAPHHKHWDWVVDRASGWLGARPKAMPDA